MINTLSDWANVAEVAGAVAVVLSLLFVGFQIRANTIATQAGTFQQHMAKETDLLTTWGSNPELAVIFNTYLNEPEKIPNLTAEQQLQGDYLFLSVIRLWEDLYLQKLAGTVSAEAWSARQRIMDHFLRNPYFGREDMSINFSGPFGEYIKQVRSRAEPM